MCAEGHAVKTQIYALSRGKQRGAERNQWRGVASFVSSSNDMNNDKKRQYFLDESHRKNVLLTAVGSQILC